MHECLCMCVCVPLCVDKGVGLYNSVLSLFQSHWTPSYSLDNDIAFFSKFVYALDFSLHLLISHWGKLALRKHSGFRIFYLFSLKEHQLC